MLNSGCTCLEQVQSSVLLTCPASSKESRNMSDSYVVVIQVPYATVPVTDLQEPQMQQGLRASCSCRLRVAECTGPVACMSDSKQAMHAMAVHSTQTLAALQALVGISCNAAHPLSHPGLLLRAKAWRTSPDVAPLLFLVDGRGL